VSGASAEHAKVQPTKLMMHVASGWAKARGNSTIHLGGGVGGGSDSLFHFKVGFSPLLHPFNTLRMVIDEREYRRLVQVRDPRLDSDDRRGYFPLYRNP